MKKFLIIFIAACLLAGCEKEIFIILEASKPLSTPTIVKIINDQCFSVGYSLTNLSSPQIGQLPYSKITSYLVPHQANLRVLITKITQTKFECRINLESEGTFWGGQINDQDISKIVDRVKTVLASGTWEEYSFKEPKDPDIKIQLNQTLNFE